MITELPERALTDEERRNLWADLRRTACDFNDLVKKGDSSKFSDLVKVFGQLEIEFDKLNWDNAARVVYLKEIRS